MPEETIAERVTREYREKFEAEQAVARAAPAVRAAIAQLDPPWSVCTSGLEIIPPQAGDLFTPYFVCLERLNGLEHKVVPYPAANTESEARTMPRLNVGPRVRRI
jgi:hypothetical protein